MIRRLARNGATSIEAAAALNNEFPASVVYERAKKLGVIWHRRTNHSGTSDAVLYDKKKYPKRSAAE